MDTQSNQPNQTPNPSDRWETLRAGIKAGAYAAPYPEEEIKRATAVNDTLRAHKLRTTYRRIAGEREGRFRENCIAASALPKALASKLFHLSWERAHADGLHAVLEDFIESVEAVTEGLVEEGINPENLTLARVTLRPAVVSGKRPMKTPAGYMKLGDKNAALYWPTTPDHFDVRAAVALSNGTYRVTEFDIRDLASVLWATLGA